MILKVLVETTLVQSGYLEAISEHKPQPVFQFGSSCESLMVASLMKTALITMSLYSQKDRPALIV